MGFIRFLVRPIAAELRRLMMINVNIETSELRSNVAHMQDEIDNLSHAMRDCQQAVFETCNAIGDAQWALFETGKQVEELLANVKYGTAVVYENIKVTRENSDFSKRAIQDNIVQLETLMQFAVTQGKNLNDRLQVSLDVLRVDLQQPELSFRLQHTANDEPTVHKSLPP